MSLDAAFAGVAGALAVMAAWEAIAAVEGSRILAGTERLLAPLARAGREGRAPSTTERRRLALVTAAALLAGGWLLAGPLAGLVVAAGGPWLALAALRGRRRRYEAGLARGAPALARALADALAGGHSVHGAVLAAAAGGGVPGAAGVELRRAAGALAMGDPVEEVLERIRARARARPIDTIVAAIGLERRAGGDLAALLRDIADSLDESVRLEHDARSATAQARFTGLLVCGLPAGAAALAELGHPGYIAGLLGSPLSAWLAGCAALLQLGALILIRRLGRVGA